MRIALANSHLGPAGGVETYLRQLWPALQAAGHELGYWCEFEAVDAKSHIVPPDAPQLWCVAQAGWEKSLRAMQDWRPDVIYAHNWSDPQQEAQMLRIAPVVFYAHAYYGACISGNKAFSFPTPRPCQRKFGPACLGLYYPRRCGGLNPLTAWREYQKQQTRLALLARCQQVLVANEYMAQEYRRYGLIKVKSLPYPVSGAATWPGPRSEKWRMLFLGRMEHLKGGTMLLDALPLAAMQLGRPLHLTMAGAGRARSAWEQKAAQLQTRHPNLTIDFPGWLEDAAKDAALRSCDVLVMPSLWPEPHGLSGLEAGHYGVPTVAFAVGGIPQWLTDGVNGVLAQSDPPTPAGLADALTRALTSARDYEKMSRGARQLSGRFTLTQHIAQLVPILVAGAERKTARTCHPEYA